MLCEGHFLDTATGIPEEDFGVLSNPINQIKGYKEPLPPEMRQAIDDAYAPVRCPVAQPSTSKPETLDPS